MFDRLMGRPVLPYRDRVVRENVNDRQFHECAETNRTSRIVAENQEPGTIGPDFYQGHAVQDRSHGMLTDPEVKVTSTRIVGRQIAGSLKGQTRFRRWAKIRRPAH